MPDAESEPARHSVKGSRMWLRILLAGIVGGILMFFTGALSHTVFELQGRTIKNVPDSSTFLDQLRQRQVKPGLYWFPDMPMGAEESDPVKMRDANDRYKVGPAGLLLVHPPGHDIMRPQMLVMEWLTNTIAALAAAWVVSLMGPEVAFGRRFAATLMIGVISWVSITASYGIWYHFPHDFVHDELYCVLLEWSVAGAAIAAIVRRRPIAPTAAPLPS
jgi:hypothetical protein